MLNFAEQTGSGAVILVWSYPLFKDFQFCGYQEYYQKACTCYYAPPTLLLGPIYYYLLLTILYLLLPLHNDNLACWRPTYWGSPKLF